ncbi:MAG TPA: hypothetical protein VMC84_01075 [Methanocella sp.]|uniref:hypothetical protein n=1 Tax=Methanocella sp. TaxID=2052833 RepID=UPI002BC25E7E|nr:hypothetical protein [Methanocella sp.]HTY89747.1 hypothetical protein [Methanocella sp.]
MSKQSDEVIRVVKKYWYMVALALIVLIALWYRLGIIDSYIIPTYGNTMYHVGIERETILTQYYPTTELSYGGGFPNFYVPAYRLLIVSMCVATGIDPMIMSGLMTIVLGIMVLLVLYVLAYRLSNNLYVALFAAFFFIMSPDITIYTMRPLPEILGLFLVPFTLLFVIREDWWLASICAAITALTHQMTLLTLVAVIGTYMLFQLIRAAWQYYKDRKDREAFMKPLRTVLGCLAPIFVACLTYAAWLVYSTGSVNIMSIAQVTNHEGNQVDVALFLRVGVFVLIFTVIGLFFLGDKLFSRPGEPKDPKGEYGLSTSVDSLLLIGAWALITLLLTFNDKIFYIFPDHKFLIFPNFMDRYLTFFAQICVIIAAYGVYAVLRAVDLDILREKP